MRISEISLFISLTLFSIGTTLAAGPPAEMLAYTCAGCHGTDGSSVGPSSPYIAGMNEEYFIESMEDYKEDKRNPTIMNRIAKAYSDEQIAGMAKFFVNQKVHLLPQRFDAGKAEQGAKYHEKYCEKCHEDGGRDASDGGTLAGQWEPYLRFSIEDFQSGKREMVKKMRKKMETMEKEQGEKAVEALINFYISQH
jgi:sulfide dehydrogenase cytochrome subunit